MNKTLNMVYRLLIILLAVAFAYTTVLPVITFKVDSSKLGEDSLALEIIQSFNEIKNDSEGLEGEGLEITSELKLPDSIEIGFAPTFELVNSFVRHIDSIKLFIEMSGEDGAGDGEVGVEGEATTPSEGHTEEELAEALLEILNDQGLADSVITLLCLVDMIRSFFDSDTTVEESVLSMMCMYFALFAFLFLMLIAFIYPIVMAIKLIVFLIRMLKHLADDDSAKVDRMICKFPFSSHVTFLLCFYLIFAICNVGGNFAPGTSITYAVVIFLIVSVLGAINAVLTTDGDRVHILIKQAISVVSIVAVAILMSKFMAVDIIGEFDNARPLISADQLIAEIANGNQSPQDALNASEAKNTFIVFIIVLLGVSLMCGTLLSIIERFSNKKVKLRGKGYTQRGSMVFVSILMLVIALYPTMIAVDSAEARDEAYSAGSFKIWYTEYLEDGTDDNIEYELLKATGEELNNELEGLRDELRSAEGERAEELASTVSDAEKAIETINDQIDDFEDRASRPKRCLIAAIILLISEIVYRIAYKAFDKKDKKAPGEPKEPEVAA